jgi:hypothetical protein
VFSGQHIRASERDGRHGRRLVIEATRAPAFTSPPGTFELHLPTASIVDVRVHPTQDPAFAWITFFGELSQTGYGTRVDLGPVLADDAARLLPLLARRYRLPKVPRVQRDASQAAALITTIGSYQPVGPRGAGRNFGPYMLELDEAQRAQLVVGQPIHVIGFHGPERRPLPGAPPVAGFAGP